MPVNCTAHAATTPLDNQRTFGAALLFGPLAALMMLAAILGLPMLVPDYDSLHQTVSEIGEVGSPAHAPFTAMLLLVGASLLVFARALQRELNHAGCSTVSAYLVACTAVSAAGVGWFSYPHPLHNVFGLSELIGYQAPLALALTLKRAPGARGLATFSWFMAALVWIAIIANLSVLDRHGPLCSGAAHLRNNSARPFRCLVCLVRDNRLMALPPVASRG